MQESRLDAALALSNGDPGPLVAATFGETLEYLVQLQDWLLQAARGLPLSMALATPDGQSPAANRVRRARQAAAIQAAVEVLRELAREQRLVLPTR